MPIPFQCAGCGKSTNVPDSYGGKKVKCKCGTVVSIALPAADEIDLDNIQFQAVEDPRERAAIAQPSAAPKLSKKEREEKVLAEKLGKDWKKPTPQYIQVAHEKEHWIIELWYMMQGSPMLAFGVFALSILMICMGVLSFDMIAEKLDPSVANLELTENGEVVPVGRMRARNFLIGPILMALGTLGATAGLYVVVMGLGSPDLKQHYPVWKRTFILVGSIFMGLVLLGFIILRALGG